MKSAMTLSIKTLVIATLGITIVSIMTFSMKMLNRMPLGTRHDDTKPKATYNQYNSTKLGHSTNAVLSCWVLF